MPTIEVQRRELKQTLKHQLVPGDTWLEITCTRVFVCTTSSYRRYLVDIRWIKQWKKYVGYDIWDQSSAGKESAYPGPLDNSNLLNKGEYPTRTHLTYNVVFELTPYYF